MASRMSTRALVEGALLAALTALLALLAQVLPFLPFFLPVPIVLMGARYGFRSSLLTVIVVWMLLAVTLGPGTALMTAVAFGSSGLAIGFGVRQKWPVVRTLALTGVATGLSSLVIFVLLYHLFGLNQMAELLNLTRVALIDPLKQMVGKYPQTSTPQFEQYIAQMELSLDLLRRTWWLFIGAGAVFSALFQYAAAKWVLGRLRLELPPIPAFSTWKMPAEAMFLLALGYGTQLVGVPYVQTLGLGLITALSSFYIVTGAALAYGLLRRYGVGKAVTIVLLVLVSARLGQVLAIAGMVDSLLDLRLWIDSSDE